MGERELPTVKVLSEVQRHEQRGVELDHETPSISKKIHCVRCAAVASGY